MDGRPLVLSVRALRSIYVAGELVPAGEVSVMLTDDALQAAAVGYVEVVGEHAERVHTSPAWTWNAPKSEQEGRQTASAWMTSAADAALAESAQPRVGEARGYAGSRPRRGLVGALELALQRWQR